jgi:hypothetical protein
MSTPCGYRIVLEFDGEGHINQIERCQTPSEPNTFCEFHEIEFEKVEAEYLAEEVRNAEIRRQNPWNVLKTCTRCGLEMPEAWEGNDSVEGYGVFQTTDGHGADVYLKGGYGEFIDGEEQVAKLCHKCGHELLEWLNYEAFNKYKPGKWFGHPQEPQDFCNGWTFGEQGE